MRKFPIVAIVLIMGLLFSYCEKNLEFQMKDKGGRLVLFSFLSPDSIFKVHLSKSVSHFSVDDFERIYGGSITLLKNGNNIDNFLFPFEASWAFRERIVFDEGDILRIEAADGEGQSAWGETVVPHSVAFQLTVPDILSSDAQNESDNFRCKMVITDPSGVKNYYQLVIFEDICTAKGGDTTCNRTRIDFSKSDPVFYVRDQEGSLIGGLDFNGLFSDFLFDGEQYDLVVDLPGEYATAPDIPGSTRKILFVLLSHTQGYYDYYRSRAVAEYGYDLPIMDPIRIYNNVEGGIGLVTAFSASLDSVVFN
jgi:hypothetical protein